MRQTAGLVINQTLVDSYTSLFKVDWAFELLWDPLLTISPNLFFLNN